MKLRFSFYLLLAGDSELMSQDMTQPTMDKVEEVSVVGGGGDMSGAIVGREGGAGGGGRRHGGVYICKSIYNL